MRYLSTHTPVVRIEADTETANIAEQRALEKSGFTREGVLRSTAFRDGQWREIARYSVLRDGIASDAPPHWSSSSAAHGSRVARS
ncbi:GNAT family protein [Streptomyces sp. ISID311]|uniref:GNAT family N-acetyltransferase n=1 Tax=Streptomyces sp. ISID311 TaxID=2601673 RepID=UPI0021C3F10F|nr:GNAT family protein [Streptomyces sp. ISID311]